MTLSALSICTLRLPNLYSHPFLLPKKKHSCFLRGLFPFLNPEPNMSLGSQWPYTLLKNAGQVMGWSSKYPAGKLQGGLGRYDRCKVINVFSYLNPGPQTCHNRSPVDQLLAVLIDGFHHDGRTFLDGPYQHPWDQANRPGETGLSWVHVSFGGFILYDCFEGYVHGTVGPLTCAQWFRTESWRTDWCECFKSSHGWRHIMIGLHIV